MLYKGHLMNNDVITVAILVFCFGVLVSSVSASGIFDEDAPAPSALQQGIAIR